MTRASARRDRVRHGQGSRDHDRRSRAAAPARRPRRRGPPRAAARTPTRTPGCGTGTAGDAGLPGRRAGLVRRADRAPARVARGPVRGDGRAAGTGRGVGPLAPGRVLVLHQDRRRAAAGAVLPRRGPRGPRRGAAGREPPARRPGLRRKLRGAGCPRGQPRRAVPGLLGRLRRRRGVPAAHPGPGGRHRPGRAHRGHVLRAGLGRGLRGAALRRHRRGVPAARGLAARDLAARARHRAGARHAGLPGGRRAVRADRPGHPQRRLAADRDGVPGHHRDPDDPGAGHPRRTICCGKKKAGHRILRRPCRRAGRGRALSRHQRRCGRVPAGPGARRGDRARARGPS